MKHYIWMNLLGFEMTDPDAGASRYLDTVGFTPDGICVLFSHPDFFHLHGGMEKEITLPPDNCSYWGVPRNRERERQPWTNYKILALSRALKARGVGLYASVFGMANGDKYHREWRRDHPEVQRHGRDGAENAALNEHCVLKRFRDGTYYEDFFIDQICRTLADYEMEGVHLADGLAPTRGANLINWDFSTDMVDQFLTDTGLSLPDTLAATMGRDDKEAETARGNYIFAHLREEFIRFMARRWNRFYEKLCRRVHGIGCRVMTLGMYCTDPFETLYCLGTDLSAIVEAGVDTVTANLLPTSVYLNSPEGDEYHFHRLMSACPVAAACLPRGHFVTMLALEDATEEWSVIEDAPALHERDRLCLTSYQTRDGEGMRQASEGFFYCLGDGLSRDAWQKEREGNAVIEEMGEEVSPVLVWSDHAHGEMLHEFLSSRRWTPFQHMAEMAKCGVRLSGTVKCEALGDTSAALFVPNFDMLSPEEMAQVAAHPHPVVATARADFDPRALGIAPLVEFSDAYSAKPLKVFAWGFEGAKELWERIAPYLGEDDGTENLSGDLAALPDYDVVLHNTLRFSKVTEGFRRAMAETLRTADNSPFRASVPVTVLRRKDGGYRLFLFNDSDVRYKYATVKCTKEIRSLKVATPFPVLPPRFIGEDLENTVQYTEEDCPSRRAFAVKLRPGGVTVVDAVL